MEKNLHGRDLEDVLAEYEIIRGGIRKALEISYVQQKIKRKLLKEDSNEIELNFYIFDEVEEQKDMDNMSMLLSTCDASIRDDSMDGLADDGLEDDGLTDDGLADDKSVEHIQKKIFHNKKNRTSRISKLVNFEAECSEEMDEDESQEDLSLEDLIDSQYNQEDDGALELFLKRKNEYDSMELERLKKKFTGFRKTPNTPYNVLQAKEFVDSDDGMPEIEDIDLDRIEFTDFDGIEHISPGKEDDAIVDNQIPVINKSMEKFTDKTDEKLFNNDKTALDRLLKREEKRGFGFFQN